MTQPRSRTPSTVSSDHDLRRDPKRREFLLEHDDASRTRSPLDFAEGRVSAVYPRVLRLACRIHASSCDAARSARVMRTIGFCHQLLQSRAPVSRSFSVRSRLALAETFLRRVWIPHAPPDLMSCLRRSNDRAPGGFTPPRWLRWIDARAFVSPRSRWRVVPPAPPSIEPMSCLSRLRGVPACESLRRGSHIALAPRSFAAESVKTPPLSDRARLPSRSAFLQLESRDSRRARRGTRSHRASLLGFVGFAANAPGTTLFHPDDPALLHANAVVSARLPFTSAYRMDAGASLSQT